MLHLDQPMVCNGQHICGDNENEKGMRNVYESRSSQNWRRNYYLNQHVVCSAEMYGQCDMLESIICSFLFCVYRFDKITLVLFVFAVIYQIGLVF